MQVCRPTRLLLVEDDPELRRMLAGLLIDEGYAVDEAPDGHRGLHLGLSRSYDLIVLDRRLPAVEGLDLLARLRTRGVTTPVLVLPRSATRHNGWMAWTPAPTTTWQSRLISTSCWPGCAPCGAGTWTPRGRFPSAPVGLIWTPARFTATTWTVRIRCASRSGRARYWPPWLAAWPGLSPT